MVDVAPRSSTERVEDDDAPMMRSSRAGSSGMRLEVRLLLMWLLPLGVVLVGFTVCVAPSPDAAASRANAHALASLEVMVDTGRGVRALVEAAFDDESLAQCSRGAVHAVRARPLLDDIERTLRVLSEGGQIRGRRVEPASVALDTASRVQFDALLADVRSAREALDSPKDVPAIDARPICLAREAIGAIADRVHVTRISILSPGERHARLLSEERVARTRGLAVALFLLTALVTWLVLHRTWTRPVLQLAEYVRRFRVGEFAAPPRVERDDEVARLTRDVVALTDEVTATHADLVKQREHLRRVIENIPGFFVMTDADMRVLYTSRASPAFDLVGMDVATMLSDEDKPKLARALRRIADGEESVRFETIHSDVLTGAALHFENVLAPLVEDSVVTGYVGYSFDATEARARDRENRLLVASVSDAVDAILFTDASENVRFVNRAFVHSMRQPADEIIGKKASILDEWLADPNDRRLVRAAMAAHAHFDDTVTFRRTDGSMFTAELTVGPVRDVSGELIGYVATHRDITDRLQRERRAAHARRMEAVGSLAAGIAHELNTPCQFVDDNLHFLQQAQHIVQPFLVDVRALARQLSVKQSSDGALGSSPMEDAETARLVAKVARAFEHPKMDFLVDELPDAIAQAREGVDRIARIVSATMVFARSPAPDAAPTDVGDVLRNAVAVAAGSWRHVAHFEVHVDEDLPKLSVHADQIGQALVELIQNAGQAIQDAVNQKMRDTAGKITCAARRVRDEVHLTVTDDGVGISPAIVDRIFEPFFTTRTVGEGLGEGLSYVHHVVVDEHHGNVVVASQPGSGSTFTVVLPMTS